MRINIISFFFFLIFNISSQELVQFSMGSGYYYDIYYSLSEGLIAYPERNNWELAFSTNSENNSIRINSGNNVTLFEVSNNIEEWDQISSMPSNAIQMRNSNLSWNLGAFPSSSSNKFDDGWGYYNTESQIIEGQRIYIISYGNSTKKIKINSLSNNVFSFTVANLDGSSEQTQSISIDLYDTKKFIYYSLQNMEILDREPAQEDWDIVFTKYEADLNQEVGGGELFYNVTGALTNKNLTYQYNGFLDVNPVLVPSEMSSNIDVIGWDWKEYAGGYTIVPNRSYFILNQDETILYKIVFQSFSGGSSGNCSFTIEQLPYNNSSIELFSKNDITISPNPNNGYFYISYGCNDCALNIVNSSGQLILSQKFENQTYADLTHLKTGLYFINLVSEKTNIKTKVFIQ